MRKLDFVIGGAQKSGTCSLYRLLREHPGIQMSKAKETHFFDDETRDWIKPDYAGLDAFFPKDDGRLRGEATPITLYWRPARARLHTYNPGIKLIFILRDPVERAFSHWRMTYSQGLETLPFDRAIRDGRSRVQSEAETGGLHRVYSYVERGFYAAQLREVLELFPAAHVHCEIFEEFFADQPAGLNRLSRFLDVAPFPESLPKMHMYKGADIDYPSTLTPDDIAYLRDLYRDDTARLEEMLGRSVPWKHS